MPGTPARCCSPEKKNALLERKRRRKADPGSLESCLPLSLLKTGVEEGKFPAPQFSRRKAEGKK